MGFSATLSNCYQQAKPYLDNYFFPFGEGLNVGNTMVNGRFVERTLRQGRNKKMTVASQVPQIYYAFSQSTKAVGAAIPALSKASLPFGVVPLTSIVLPSLVAFAASRKIENVVLRKIVNFAHDHIGTMCQIAVVIASIALCIFGNPILGGVTLACMTLGFMDELGLLPEKVRQILHKSSMPIAIATGLIVGDWFMKVIAVAQIVMAVVGKILDWKAKRLEAELKRTGPQEGEYDKPVRPISLADLQEIDKQTVDIHKGHLRLQVGPPIPRIDLEELVTHSEQVDWNGNLRSLQVALNKDPRWREVGYSPGHEIEYAKQQIKDMVHQIKHKKIRAGEPLDYSKLQDWCRYITYQVKQKMEKVRELKEAMQKGSASSDDQVRCRQLEIQIADTFIDLAAEGGNYCGPGIYKAVKAVYKALLIENNNQEIPLRDRILIYLENKRNRLFEGIYEIEINGDIVSSFLSSVFDLDDVHAYNQTVKLFANEEFGLNDEVAKNDPAVVVDPLSKVLLSRLLFKMRTDFWQGTKPEQKRRLKKLHTPEAQKARFFEVWKKYAIMETEEEVKGYKAATIVEELQETLACDQLFITQEDVFDWWKNWIKRQDMSDIEKEKGVAELNDELTLSGEPLLEAFEKNGVKRSTIKGKFLKAMLLEMGVFQVMPTKTVALPAPAKPQVQQPSTNLVPAAV